MGLIRTLIDGHNRKVQERNEACNGLIAQIDAATSSLDAFFSDMQNFVEPQKIDIWLKQSEPLLNMLAVQNIEWMKKAARYRTLLEGRTKVLKKVEFLPQRVQRHNHQVAETRIRNAYTLLGDVEGRMLDRQQMLCIVKEAQNHLVIAGAGTGKTTTVVGKIKFLLKSGKCNPQDILVLSYTNASADEMSRRIQAETGVDIAASTFHKLGLNIIAEVDGIKPKITRINLREFVKGQLRHEMESEKYLRLLNSYLLYGRIAEKSEFEFHTEQEYKEYLTLNPPTTINHETVKSYGEMDIANFLAQNGVRYIYEQPYVIDTRTSDYGQYYPDFYLPDYNIYIEYFGINQNGEVPPYFKGKNGESASQTYQESMAWKRRLHKDNHTIMLECFAYEKFAGVMLEVLEEKLKDASVILNPQDPGKLWQSISAENHSVLDGIIELFETLINLIKSNEYNIEVVRNMNNGKYSQSNDRILSLLEPVYNSYCGYLEQNNEIDFNDMINLAVQYIRQGKYINPYRYVIVDEYQDISKARYKLLRCLRDSRDYELFCVGDDWQSIYRFAGSDISFILNFAKYWGATEISKIETTYRFSQKLIQVSSEFIMRNPIQIQKRIQGRRDEIGFPLGEISGYTEKTAVQFMAEKLRDLPFGSSVFFIGRYTFDVNLLKESDIFSCNYNNANGMVEVLYRPRKDLEMFFITAHKSKGLQADYIFIINNKKSKMGFPSKIQDAPILSLLLDNYDEFPYAEERRLFYVSLTRAKKKVYLLTISGQESEFAMEIKKRYEKELRQERFTCPLCGGRLVKRSGSYGEFWGCSNYRTLECKYTRNIRHM